LLMLSIFDIEVRTRQSLFSRDVKHAFLVVDSNKKMKPSLGLLPAGITRQPFNLK
jgi:hypothetical protein